MQNDVILAGFGGQGVLLIGKMLAYAGLNQGKEVSWLPSYGPEMRGGTANCTVVISDKPVRSPVIKSPTAVVAMNLPSLDKFEPAVKPGGMLFVNSSLISREVNRTDLTAVRVPANDIANELENPKGANMVILGAYLGVTNAVDLEKIEDLIRDVFSAKPKVIEANIKALHRGVELGKQAVQQGGD